ncbi:MAG: alpha/beta hydrolase [Acidobacteria bacterium]|nr:alpha/beta hydrolase [Acidobacteriota bacterium]
MLRAKDEGRLRLHRRFPSRYLSTPRDIAVYLPPGYDPHGRRYPVFYLQDGQNLFDPATAFLGQDWQADITADALIRLGEIEPVILVGVYNTGVRRVSEYTPTRDPQIRKGGKADRYAELLARELKPFIDREYRTLKAASHTGVGGSSLGGLVSLMAALCYPKVFGRVAVISPSVWWDRRAILHKVEAFGGDIRPRIWLDAGTAEGSSPESVVADVKLLRETLTARGWRDGHNLRYWEDEGAGHNELAWGYRFGLVLRYLFPAHLPD